MHHDSPVRRQALLDEASRPDRIAFEIGWDHAHYRLAPPCEHLHEGHPVRDGWLAGQAVFGVRTLQPTPHVRKWLQLRLNAWLRGKVFEPVAVTPRLLQQIDVPVCPVTGEVLTHGTGGPADASVDRVNNDAGYAAGNLAVMSARANRAKSHYGWRDCADFARQVEVGRLGSIDGLDAREWSRLAVLTSFCTPLSHAEAASLPLLLLPPPRLRVLNAAQALQALITVQFARPGQVPRLDRLLRLFPDAVRPFARSLCTTLLARRRRAGTPPDAPALRRAMEDAWADPLVLDRWRRVSLRLDAASCERIVEAACLRGLGGHDVRWLPLDRATDGWSLETGGRVPSAVAGTWRPPASRTVPEAASVWRLAERAAASRPPARFAAGARRSHWLGL